MVTLNEAVLDRAAKLCRERGVVIPTLAQMREGKSLSEAYYRALLFTGKVVMLTGITLAIGVITWAASPIKFQADMGILLAFMFLWNMVGALVLLPALARWLLRPQAAPSMLPAGSVPAR